MRARYALQVLALILGCFVSPFAAMAGPFSGIVAFGDSLSDAGNVFIATGIPTSPYFAGHFSNGPTWVENLSQDLGLGTLRPSLTGGTDFAFGTAKTGNFVPGTNPIFPNIPNVPNITEQVDSFLSSTGGVAPSTNLYTMWIGSNDVFQAALDVSQNASSLPAIVSAIGLAAQAEANAVSTLASKGATTFIVPLIGDLGKAPAVTTVPGLGALATQLATLYNADLINDLNAIGGGVTVHLLDTFSLTDAIVNNPAGFGLTDATHACYTGPLTGAPPPPSPCATPNTFLYWDAVHPTEAGHELIAGLAEQSVPEPTSLAIFGSALVAMGVLGRRRRSGVQRQGRLWRSEGS